MLRSRFHDRDLDHTRAASPEYWRSISRVELCRLDGWEPAAGLGL